VEGETSRDLSSRQWALSWPDVLAAAGLARALQLMAFAAAGPAHVMALGILLAGVSVMGSLHRLLPRWMMMAGLVLAALAELSGSLWSCRRRATSCRWHASPDSRG
jgi:hypothetical protein